MFTDGSMTDAAMLLTRTGRNPMTSTVLKREFLERLENLDIYIIQIIALSTDENGCGNLF